MNDLENLMSEVQKCVDKDKRIKKEQFQHEERFNVFSVLNLRTDEARTHSAFLAELLDPHGSHGCGVELLRIFLKKCGLPDFSEEDLRKAYVIAEYYIGSVDDEEGGGWTAILIQLENWTVIIENKIYYGDLSCKILNYHEFTGSDPMVKIFFLTLDGHEASLDSTGGKLKAGEDYFLMSYKKDIRDFIQESEHVAIQRPLVRETLIQYENLIKELTSQDM